MVSKKYLGKANSLFQVTNQIGQFIVPGLAGALVTLLPKKMYVSIMLVFAIAFLVIAYFIIGINRNKVESTKKSNSLTKRIGYTAIFKDQTLVLLMFFTCILNLSVLGPQQIGLPIYVSGVLKNSTGFYGVLASMFGAGSFLGSLISVFFKKQSFSSKKIMKLSILFSVIWGLFSYFTSTSFILLLIFIGGALIGCINVIFLTLLQKNTPNHLLGKTMSLQFLASSGLQPLSYLLTGTLITQTSVQSTFLIFGFLAFLGSLVFLFKKDLTL